MAPDTVQHHLAALSSWLDRLLFAACVALLAMIFFCVFTGVVIRYVVTVPWPWTEEVARFCLVWFAPLAAAIGARKGLHFSFQWGVMPFGEKTRIVIRQVMNVVTLAFLALLLVQSLSLIEVMSNQTAMATEIDMRIPASGIVVGIGALIAIYVIELLDAFLALFTGRHLSLREQQEAANIRLLETAQEGGIVDPALEPALGPK